METYYRTCVKDFKIEDSIGQKLHLKEGDRYLTSRASRGRVMVFCKFWMYVPLKIFSNVIRFT